MILSRVDKEMGILSNEIESRRKVYGQNTKKVFEHKSQIINFFNIH